MMHARRLVVRYDAALTATPIRTKVATSFSILTGADVVRQLAVERRPTLDAARTARMAAWGATVHPIWIHYWFQCMEAWRPSYAVITAANRGAVARLTLQKVAVDTLSGSPAFIAMFLAIAAALESRGSLAAVREKLRADWLSTACAAWSFWPAAHLVSLSVIPVHWRLLYINVLSLGWGTYLSGVAASTTSTTSTTTPARLPVDRAWNTLTGGTHGLAGARGAHVAILGVTSVAWASLAALYIRTFARTGPAGIALCVIGCGTTALVASSSARADSASAPPGVPVRA